MKFLYQNMTITNKQKCILMHLSVVKLETPVTERHAVAMVNAEFWKKGHAVTAIRGGQELLVLVSVKGSPKIKLLN